MGNFEKLVVLAVLVLSAIVLAVSLNRDQGEPAASGPFDAAQERLGEADPSLETLATDGEEAPEAKRPGYLLYGEVNPPAEAPLVEVVPPRMEPSLPTTSPPAAVTRAEPRILRTTLGLEPSVLEDFMLYSVEAGDSWSALARRFYGDVRYVANLRMANEGMSDLHSGTRIFVPVFDLDEEAGTRARFKPAPVTAAAEAAPPGTAVSGPIAATGQGPANPVDASLRDATVYEVQPGDSLSEISVLVYGTSSRWKEIFEANRQQLTSPDWLQVGQKLVIPRGAQSASGTVPPTARATDPNRPRVR